MNERAQQVMPPRPMHTAHWIIAIALAVIATALWMRPGAGMPVALGQNQGMAGARGVYAFTGQLDSSRYGLFMLDVDQGTIWCYEIEQVDGVRKLKLVAGRTWTYDRYLQDFNCAKPDFRTVQQLVTQQRNASTADSVSPAAPDAAADLPVRNP
jgi:hypothetical protein